MRSLAIIWLALASYLSTHAAQVGTISIDWNGAPNVTEDQILSSIRLREGGSFSRIGLTNAIRQLYHSGKFDDVEASMSHAAGKIDVTFRLTPAPKVMAISFSGNKKFSDAVLKKELTQTEGDMFSGGKVGQDLRNLVEFYHDRGYPNFSVELKIKRTKEDQGARITYIISEGPHAPKQRPPTNKTADPIGAFLPGLPTAKDGISAKTSGATDEQRPAADGRPTIRLALLPSHNQSADTDEAHWMHFIDESLQRMLWEIRSNHVIPTDYGLRKLNLEEGDEISILQAREIGKLVGVSHIVRIAYTRKASEWQLTLDLVGVQDERSQQFEFRKSSGNWQELLGDAVRFIIKQSNMTPTAAESARITANNADSPEAIMWSSRAWALIVEDGPVAEIEACARRALQVSKTCSAARACLVYVHYTRQEWEAARKIAKQMVATAPEDSRSHYCMAVAHANQPTKSEAFFKQSVTLSPHDWRLIVNLAQVQAMQGKLKEALASLERATAINPTGFLAPFVTAKVHLMANRRELARQALARAEKYQPSTIPADDLLSLAGIHASLGNPQKSVSYCRQYLKVAERESEPQANIERTRSMLAHLERQLKRSEPSAIAALTAQAQKGDAEAQYELAERMRHSNPKETVQWLLRAANQGYAKAQTDLGTAYASGKGVAQNYEKAITWYTKAAKQGRAIAQFNLATHYATGTGVPQDYAKAVHWLRQAAEQGHPDAQSYLGSFYHAGLGVPKNAGEARKWLTRAALQKNALAECLLAIEFGESQRIPKDPREEHAWLKKAAQKGYAIAQHNVGVTYADGIGVQQNYEEAASWYAKAATQGYPPAQHNLASLYFHGTGLPQDYRKAIEWYEKAASEGLVESQAALGANYALAQGVPRNYPKAIEWLTKAAEQGNPDAQSLLGEIYLKGKGGDGKEGEARRWLKAAVAQKSPQAIFLLSRVHNQGLLGFEKDPDEAWRLKRQAADLGHRVAQYQIGLAYNRGLGPYPEDLDRGMKWYRKAAASGLAIAQFEVGTYYMSGQKGGATVDWKEACKWFKLAASQGHTASEANLAIAYKEGLGVEPDQQKTFLWAEKAAAKHHPQGQYELAICYLDGNGVAKNQPVGLEWLRKSALQGWARAQHELGMRHLRGSVVERDTVHAYGWLKLAASEKRLWRQSFESIQLGMSDVDKESGDKTAAKLQQQIDANTEKFKSTMEEFSGDDFFASRRVLAKQLKSMAEGKPLDKGAAQLPAGMTREMGMLAQYEPGDEIAIELRGDASLYEIRKHGNVPVIHAPGKQLAFAMALAGSSGFSNLKKNAGGRIQVKVECLDDRAGARISLNYDAQNNPIAVAHGINPDNPGQPREYLSLRGTKKWVTLIFDLPEAKFSRRQLDEADFSLVCDIDGALSVRFLEVSRMGMSESEVRALMASPVVKKMEEEHRLQETLKPEQIIGSWEYHHQGVTHVRQFLVDGSVHFFEDGKKGVLSVGFRWKIDHKRLIVVKPKAKPETHRLESANVMILPWGQKANRITNKEKIVAKAIKAPVWRNSLKNLKFGDRLDAKKAPRLAGKPFEINATIEPAAANGIILAHGGSVTGFVLYTRAETVVFGIRKGGKLKRLFLPFSGKSRIRAGVDGSGRLWLRVNEDRRRTAAPVGFMDPQPAEAFNVGSDQKSPVDRDAPKASLKGKISGVTVLW